MKLKILLPILLLTVTMLGCKEEVAIQPDALQPEYTLPQGNHDYDARIVDFQRKYGTYILYEFTDKDFRWNLNSELPYVADQGDQNYIAPALNALDQYLFHYYSDDFLKKTLPYKIILSARIRKLVPSWVEDKTDTLETPLSTVGAFSHIAFGFANEQLTTMSADELKQMKADLHAEFWKQAVVGKRIEIPPVFAASTDYTQVFDWTAKDYGAFGEFKPEWGSTDYNLEIDFAAYIKLIVLTTTEELEQTLFLPENDPNGKYRLKYNAIVNYYKQEYAVNLQAIVN